MTSPWEWYAGTMELLTEAEITAELAAVPAWTRDGNSITTVTTRKDFRDALLYLGAVAYLAETRQPSSRHRDLVEQGDADAEHAQRGRPDRERLRAGPPDLGPVLTARPRAPGGTACDADVRRGVPPGRPVADNGAVTFSGRRATW